MNKFTFFLVCALFYCSTLKSQNVEKTSNGIKTTINGTTIGIGFFSPDIVRIVKTPAGGTEKKMSLSVIKKPETVKLTINQEGDLVLVKSKTLVVSLNLKTNKVSFSRVGGEVLLSEKDMGTQFTPFIDAGKNSFDVSQTFSLDKDEVIYGLGQQQEGKMSQRGQKLKLEQNNTRVCIPFFQSVKGYGIFWDNYSPTIFNDDDQGTSFDSAVGNCSDYYFLWGGSGDGVVTRMRDLTGQAPMMPLWVYGFNQSRERYKNQYELVEAVRKYRSLKVPLDGIIQDWQYWGKDTNWNSQDFDPARYPDPQGMVDSVHMMNAHLFIVTWPGFGPETKQAAYFKEKKLLIDFDTYPSKIGVRPYDVYNPAARDMYWSFLNKGVFSHGIDGWWLDSTEPDHSDPKEKDYEQHTYLGSFRSVRNAFPLMHVGGVYDHQRQTSLQKRVTILTRSAFAGQQRYAANTWSGDLFSKWDVFKKQIPAGLNFSLCGIPYWNTDIGGFYAGEFVKGGGAKNPDFQELYTRWFQFGTFTPMMRSHGTDINREIYQFGERGSRIFDIQEKFINLRYSLLPYIYSTAWDVTIHSGSFMRALFMDFPADKQVYQIGTEYLFGKSILVAPVTEKNATSQLVYLPSGSLWYDFWTSETSTGGKTINRATPLDILPLYVKAGSIIPWGPKVQYASEKKWDTLKLFIYPGSDGDFTLYEDENDNYNYENGRFSEIRFHWNDNTRALTLGDRTGSFSGLIPNRKFNIVLINSKSGKGPVDISQADKLVSYTGKPITVKF